MIMIPTYEEFKKMTYDEMEKFAASLTNTDFVDMNKQLNDTWKKLQEELFDIEREMIHSEDDFRD